MRDIRPLHVVPDDERHGVARYARHIAAAAGCPVATQPSSAPGQRLHVHFTDRLWGASPGAAAERIERLAGSAPLTVTLHDLPQASDGAASRDARADAYRRVVGAADGVACASVWERELLDRIGVPPRAVRIIPLSVAPVSARRRAIAGPPGPAKIGVLGWVYPGKGHREAIDAAADIAAAGHPPVRVLAIGAAAPGHAAEVAALESHAGRRHVEFSVTGYLSDAALIERAQQVSVPLAAHRHISASGSINSWIAAGRRPLVVDSPYAREIDALRPGTVHLCDPDRLPAAIEQVLAEPRRSWLDPAIDLSPGPAETAAAYLRWWSEVRW